MGSEEQQGLSPGKVLWNQEKAESIEVEVEELPTHMFSTANFENIKNLKLYRP